jgi:uncharacterized repeat protein (TIGR02543 family)
MAKTYTLNATSVNGGGAGSWSSGYWGNYYGTSVKRVGMDGSSPRATNILFDASTLATLRTKTITSINLTISLSNGIPNSSSERYAIGYKLNSTTTTAGSGTAWTRSNASSTSASTTTICYMRTTTSSSQTSGTFTFDMGTTVPVYGYVCGPNSTSSGYLNVSGTPQLVVTTNETDYTLKLSYDANNGSGAPSQQSQTVTTTGTPSYTFTISNTSPTRTGYTFLGWSTSSSASTASYQPGGSITISSNTTLYAVWQQITYTVSYDKGSTGTGTNVTDTKYYDTALTLRGITFTRTGYTQTGWSTSDGGNLAYSLSASYTENANVTLYPFWTINTYVVTYNKGADGTGSNVTATKTYGTDLTLLGSTFIRTGYTQTGWSTTDGGAKDYNLSGTYSTDASVTLYPYWTINTYTISYNKGSKGTGTNTTDTKTYGTNLTLLGATFTRVGYYQSGWSVSDGGAYTYALSATYTNNASVTLYPYWTAYAVTVQYKANGGSLSSEHGSAYAIDGDGYITRNGSRNIQTFNYGDSNTLQSYNNPNGINLVRDGYRIEYESEWNTSADGTGTTFDQEILYSASNLDPNVSSGNQTLVLYANWVTDTYTISYDANGGSGAPSPQTKTYGVDLTLSATIPVNGNMHFMGWAETSYATQAQYQPSGTFSRDENTTLYAVWGISNSSVRIMGSDGSLHQYPLYYMTNNGLVNASVYYMGSDGTLHPQQ